MQLNFKKIIIIFICFVFGLVVGGGIYLIKNKQKVKQEQFPDIEKPIVEDKEIPLEEEFVKLSKEEQAECLQAAETMTDDELIKEVLNIRHPWGIVEEVNKDRKTYAQKQLFRHFICRLEREKDEELYKKTRDFVQGWGNVPEESKEIELDWLEEVYSVTNPYAHEKIFTVVVAFDEINELCSEEFTEFCYYKAKQVIGDIEPWFCDNTCEKLDKLLNDEEYYNLIVLDLIDPVTNEFQFISFPDISNIKTWRIALAYDKGGEEEVNQICNNLASDKQRECRDYIQEIVLILKEYEGRCNNYFDNVKNEICEY